MTLQDKMKMEVIFNKHSWEAIGAISPSKDFCLKAMEEYANQEKIAYAVEVLTNLKYSTKDINSDQLNMSHCMEFANRKIDSKLTELKSLQK